MDSHHTPLSFAVPFLRDNGKPYLLFLFGLLDLIPQCPYVTASDETDMYFNRQLVDLYHGRRLPR
jgi:hypothetical protein